MTDRLSTQIAAGCEAVAALASGVAAIAAITAALLASGGSSRASVLLEEQHKQHMAEALKVFSEYADAIEAGNRGERPR